jgi:peptidoglycan hydrolase CwlO-like protein
VDGNGNGGGAWRPLGQVLLDHGEITQSDLHAALAEQQASGRRLGEILIESGRITWEALAHAIADQAGVLTTDADSKPAGAEVAALPLPTDVERLQGLLRERQREFFELASTAEQLRRKITRLEEQLAAKNAELAQAARAAAGKS